MNLERIALLLKRRMDALASRSTENPHFLFNTLNTVSALIRFDSDTARGVVAETQQLLRRLLRKHETFVPLPEELEIHRQLSEIEWRGSGETPEHHQTADDEYAGDFCNPACFVRPIVGTC